MIRIAMDIIYTQTSRLVKYPRQKKYFEPYEVIENIRKKK